MYSGFVAGSGYKSRTPGEPSKAPVGCQTRCSDWYVRPTLVTHEWLLPTDQMNEVFPVNLVRQQSIEVCSLHLMKYGGDPVILTIPPPPSSYTLEWIFPVRCVGLVRREIKHANATGNLWAFRQRVLLCFYFRAVQPVCSARNHWNLSNIVLYSADYFLQLVWEGLLSNFFVWTPADGPSARITTPAHCNVTCWGFGNTIYPTSSCSLQPVEYI